MQEYEEGLHLIPRHMHDGVKLYIERGLPHIGSFLRAVMENKFIEAFACADDINAVHLREWANFIYNYTPNGCHGSPERVKAWMDNGGLQGIELARHTADA